MKVLFVASCCNNFTRHTCRLTERYNNKHFAAIAENGDVVENTIGIGGGGGGGGGGGWGGWGVGGVGGWGVGGGGGGVYFSVSNE